MLGFPENSFHYFNYILLKYATFYDQNALAISFEKCNGAVKTDIEFTRTNLKELLMGVSISIIT